MGCMLLLMLLLQCGAAATPPATDRWQRHLVGTGDPTEMVVSFATAQRCADAAVRLSALAAGHTATRLIADHTVAATTAAFDPATAWACTKLPKPDGNVSRRELFFHDARLIGLAATTRYEYAVGGCGNWSAPAIFTTEAPRSFAVVADFGHQRAAPRTHEALRAP